MLDRDGRRGFEGARRVSRAEERPTRAASSSRSRSRSASASTCPTGVDSDATPWDARSVATLFPELATSSDGRGILRLYYAATDATGRTTIALAARYGTDGPFSRADAPVFGMQGPKNPREPCVVNFAAATLLYVTEPSDTTMSATPAVAVGVAPALTTLPPPNPM